MKRIRPRDIQDKYLLAMILDNYLTALQESPLNVAISALAFDSHIPESVFQRMRRLNDNPEDSPNIQIGDYHILFSNILFRYPTVKIWQEPSGSVFIEL